MKALDVFCWIVGTLFAIGAILFVLTGIDYIANQNEFLLAVQNGEIPLEIVE